MTRALWRTATSARRRLVFRFFRHDLQFQFFRPAKNRQRAVHPDRRVGEQSMQIIDTRDRLAIQPDDHVSLAQARAPGRSLFFDRHDDHAAFFRKIIKANQAAVKRRSLGFHADVAAADSSVLQQAPGNKLSGVDTDGETQSLRAHDCGRIYADDLAVESYKRSTGIAGVE